MQRFHHHISLRRDSKKVQKSKQESRKCEPETVHGRQRRINKNKLTSKHPLRIIIPPGQLTANEIKKGSYIGLQVNRDEGKRFFFLLVSLAHNSVFNER